MPLRATLMFAAALALVAQSQLDGPESVLQLKADTGHVQGIVVASGRLWVSSVDVKNQKGWLYEFALPSGDLRRSIQLQDGVRFHPGGLSMGQNGIWAPVAEYRRASTSVIQRRDKQTLEQVSSFHVQDHIGCVAVTANELVGANWDARQLYVWRHDGTLLRKVDNPTNNAFQDMKFVDGQLVGSGLLPDKSGAIDWLEYPSLRPIRRMIVGRTDRNVAYTHEGMDITGDRLWLLPEDAPSRLFEFRLGARRR